MANFLMDRKDIFLKNIMGLKQNGVNGLGEIDFSTVIHLSGAIDNCNRKLLEHSFRVASLCKDIATELKMSVDVIKTISIGSLLHDIGVIGLSKRLFVKKTVWDKNELSEYCRHTICGKEIIEPVLSLRTILPFIEKHHEYIDGSGYPNALKKQDIPFEVRILTVVNDFDMMSENWLWGKKYSFEENIEKIKSNSSILYDAKVVETFVKLIGKTNNTE